LTNHYTSEQEDDRMLLDQRIAQIIAALAREATTAPLSPQRLARLLTLHQELGDVLTTADKALRGGLRSKVISGQSVLRRVRRAI
jgi:hypothetical protein